MKRIESNFGITLISLVITVIIMLILVGVTLSTVFDDGLMKDAEYATEKYSSSSEEEKENVGKLMDELEFAFLDKNAIAKKVKVGDYVAYTADGTIPENLPFNLTRQNINWRVLKNDGKNVTLISETPIDSIQLVGIEDWKNGMQKIDTTYAGLYSGTKGKARNLSEDDINEITGFDKENEANWSFSDLEFKYHKVPAGIRTIAELEEYAEQNNWGANITQDYTPDGRDLDEYEPNYYYYSGATYKNEENSLQCDMIFGEHRTANSLTPYWINSKCVWVNFADNCVNYCVGKIIEAYIDPQWLYDSYHSSNNPTGAGRPIVKLNFNVAISPQNEGDGSSPEKAWQLK